MRVELKAAFGGLSWLPSWIALTSSNASPHLILEEDGIDCKVIRNFRKRYDDVALVDFRKGWGTRNIAFRFKSGSWTFTGNAVSDEEARAGLAFLRDKGCPLTDRAMAFAEAR